MLVGAGGLQPSWLQVLAKTAVGRPGNLEDTKGHQNGTHEYMYQHRISYKKMVVSVSIPQREAQLSLPPASCLSSRQSKIRKWVSFVEGQYAFQSAVFALLSGLSESVHYPC